MRTILLAALLHLVTLSSAQEAYYLYSLINDGFDPWYEWEIVHTSSTYMDSVFGEEGIDWKKAYFETVDPSIVFADSISTIYMEGGENTTAKLEIFLEDNLPLIEEWVYDGGHLFINSAPNIGIDIEYGFGGVVSDYPTYITYAKSAKNEHPIFNGPALPVGLNWEATYFSHANILGDEITPLIIDSEDSSSIALAELEWGSGIVLFGTITPAYFHEPEIEASNLCINILSYLKSVPCVPTIPTGLYSDNISTTKARLHWDSIPGVDKYSVSVFNADGTLFIKKSTTANFLNVKLLSPGSNYVFKVRSMCVDEGTQSTPSAPSYFTTLTREGILDNTIAIYPNPNNGEFNLNISAMEDGPYVFNLKNTTGQVVYTKDIMVQDGTYSAVFSLNHLPPGIYICTLSNINSFVNNLMVID
jgi:hypothetical protein